LYLDERSNWFEKKSLNINKQIQLMNNLDIRGIFKTTNESLFYIFVKFSSLVNINLKENVSKLYRSKIRNDLNSNIIVIFNNKNNNN